MKRTLGFLGFLSGYTVMLLGLVDAKERIEKLIPMVNYLGARLTGSMEALIEILPRAPSCSPFAGSLLSRSNCQFSFLFFWPMMAVFFLNGTIMLFFLWLYSILSVRARAVSIRINTFEYVLIISLGPQIVNYLVWSWLLHKYSGLSIWSALALSYGDQLNLVKDKNFYILATIIYSPLIIFTYTIVFLLIYWAWIVYTIQSRTDRG